jgi:HPt (histidine-containing phosphotransfer) domain-containing protein
MANSDALDATALQELLETTGGDRSFLAELIDTFLAEAPTLLADMQRALADGRADELRRAAHSLKSTSASFGAHGLARLARQIEEPARAGTLGGLDARVAEARAEYARVEAALRAARPDEP